MRVLSITDTFFVWGGNLNDTTGVAQKNIYDALQILGPAYVGSLGACLVNSGDLMVTGIVGATSLIVIVGTFAAMYYFEMAPYEFFFPNNA